jgi:HEAT repeat protein
MTQDSSVLLKYCRELALGIVDLPFYANPPIPHDLAVVYARRIAAQEIAKHFPNDPVGEAVLVRAALASEDDDRVRVEALQQLIVIGSSHAQSVMLALLFDQDEELRIAALEGLAIVKSPLLDRAAMLLVDDCSDDVSTLAQQIMNSEEIPLYKLDPV